MLTSTGSGSPTDAVQARSLSIAANATAASRSDADLLQGAFLALPRGTRRVSLRVVCRQLPESVSTARGRVLDSVCLGVGEPGRDPDLVFSGGQHVAIVDTHLDLTPAHDGSLAVDGPYLAGETARAALALRWGVRSAGQQFLLFGGTYLCLPRLVTTARYRRRGDATHALALTVSLTDTCGAPLLGIVEADDLGWRLTARRALARTPHRGDVQAEGA